MMMAVGWAAASVAICFFWLSRVWSVVLGRDTAFYGATAAFLLCLGIARMLLVAADRLVGADSADDLAPVAEPPDRWGYDWRAYTAELIGMKRWAYYRRTGQFERLAELELEEQGRPATGARAPAGAGDRQP